MKLRCIHFLFLLFWFTKVQAQSIQVGAYSGITYYKNDNLFFEQLTDAEFPAFDYSLFMRCEFKRFAVEARIGSYLHRKYDESSVQGLQDPSSGIFFDYYTDEKDEFYDHQWNFSVQYCFYRSKLQRLKCFAGLAYTLYSEYLNQSLEQFKLQDSANVFRFKGSRKLLTPYYGINFKVEYNLSKRILLNGLLQYQTKIDGHPISDQGNKFIMTFKAPSAAYSTLMLGISYLLYPCKK